LENLAEGFPKTLGAPNLWKFFWKPSWSEKKLCGIFLQARLRGYPDTFVPMRCSLSKHQGMMEMIGHRSAETKIGGWWKYL
jgi:hypothetical protein